MNKFFLKAIVAYLYGYIALRRKTSFTIPKFATFAHYNK